MSKWNSWLGYTGTLKPVGPTLQELQSVPSKVPNCQKHILPQTEMKPIFLSKQTPRYQTVAGNWVFSVLSSDPMGGSYPWVHVPWPIKFGPRATHGLAGACLHFSPLPKVIFRGALSQPFWIAESWFLLRNFWHYNLPRIWYDISSNQKFCILRFSTLWNTFKKNFI